MTKLIRICLILALLSPAATLKRLDGSTPFGFLQRIVTKFTLANGLTVIVVERNRFPLTTFVTVANVGSVDDPQGKSGLAHMQEHMAFKGTSCIGTKDWAAESIALRTVDSLFLKLEAGRANPNPGTEQLEHDLLVAQQNADSFIRPDALSNLIEAHGGSHFSARTTRDATLYYVTMPSEMADLWFRIESSRFSDPVFRGFLAERNVVAEERRLRVDANPQAKLMEQLLATAFTIHPYGNSAIGSMEEIAHFSRIDTEQFFHEHYSPRNLTLIIVGSLKAATAKRLAETYFAPIPNRTTVPYQPPSEPPQDHERRCVIQSSGRALVALAYRTNLQSAAKLPAYRAMCNLLAGGVGSVLYERLVKEKQIATSVDFDPFYPGVRFPSLLLIRIIPAGGVEPDKILREVDQAVHDFTAAPPTASDLDGSKNQLLNEVCDKFDSNLGLAMELGTWQAARGDWAAMLRYAQGINAIEATAVQDMARSILKQPNRTIGILQSKTK
jgi:predicted Zn-dependent peptidase